MDTGRKRFGKCDGRIEEMRILLHAGTELVRENFSNCQGKNLGSGTHWESQKSKS